MVRRRVNALSNDEAAAHICRAASFETLAELSSGRALRGPGGRLLFRPPTYVGSFVTAATGRIEAARAYFGRDFSSARILSVSARVAGL